MRSRDDSGDLHARRFIVGATLLIASRSSEWRSRNAALVVSSAHNGRRTWLALAPVAVAVRMGRNCPTLQRKPLERTRHVGCRIDTAVHSDRSLVGDAGLRIRASTAQPRAAKHEPLA